MAFEDFPNLINAAFPLRNKLAVPKKPANKLSAGSFDENNNFIPNEEAQNYLNQFIQNNPNISNIKIKPMPDTSGPYRFTEGFFNDSDPNAIYLNPQSNDLITFVHELDHLRKNADGTSSKYTEDTHKNAFELAHKFHGNFKEHAKQLLEGGYRGALITPDISKYPKPFDVSKHLQILNSGYGNFADELSARNAEKKLLESNPKYSNQLNQWRQDPWTVEYPVSSIYNLTDLLYQAKSRGTGVFINNDTVPVHVSPQDNYALKLAFEVEPFMNEETNKAFDEANSVLLK